LACSAGDIGDFGEKGNISPNNSNNGAGNIAGHGAELPAQNGAAGTSSPNNQAGGGSGGGSGQGGSGESGGSSGTSGSSGVGGSSGSAGGSGAGTGGSSSVDPASSHGQGGLPCTTKTTQYTGQSYCLSQIGDLELKVFVPKTTKPMQIAIYLHGDTANGYLEDWGFETLAQWSIDHGVMLVAALAPNGCSWWRPPWTCGADQYDDDGYNSQQLVDALGKISESYDVFTSNLLLVGYSGGSTFLTRQFVPNHGDKHPGLVVANCGGVPPKAFTWQSTTESRKAIPIVYTFGTEDFMTEYIYPSIAEYESLGFDVSQQALPGYGHCDSSYDWDTRTLDLWESHLLVIP
jgi:predicted esterase